MSKLNNSAKKEEILVIDDTSANLKLISDFLREHGYKVWIAKNGVQALKILEGGLPDLILLDVMMPEMDGFETCRRIKACPKTQDIPIIFMTAIADFANPEHKVKGLALGAVDYVSKPIQLEEVLARIKTHLHLHSLTKQLQKQNQKLQKEIEERQQAQRLLAEQNQILEMIASDMPLSEILDSLARLVEKKSGEIRCSFLLLDRDNRLRFCAGPSLPQSYSNAVDGVAIGPNVGSCGAAAYHKETVIVSDIATNPLWANFRDIALSYGLRACWSVPILSSQDTVLGTFAGYYSQPQTVTQLDKDLIAQTLYLAKIAIQRQQSQEALQESEAQAREKAQALEKTLNELKRTQVQLIQSEKMSALGKMVGGIAHEINNPVSFIGGNLNFVREYFQSLNRLLELYQETYQNPTPKIEKLSQEIDLQFLLADWSKLINSMEVGVQRIEHIVVSLRNFSRLDEAELKSVDIYEGIENTLYILQHRLSAEGVNTPGKGSLISPAIKVIKDYRPLPRVTCYPSELNQVFMNLLTNAIEALENQTPPRSIVIRTEVENEKDSTSIPSVVIRIADNGCGISEEVQQKIFDPFFTTKPVGSGTGLGLSISHQIVVEKHKGQLKCISAKYKGTEFIVKIPIHQKKPINREWEMDNCQWLMANS